MKMIVINGSGGCGKDTFIDLCEENRSTNIERCSTIDPIKNIARNIGWNEIKDEKNRKFLSDLKDLLTEYNDYSFNYVKNIYEKLINKQGVLFVHCREPKEIQKLKEYFNAITLLIKADNRVKMITSNHADRDVKNYKYDYVITNDGTLGDLCLKAKDFLSMVGDT